MKKFMIRIHQTKLDQEESFPQKQLTLHGYSLENANKTINEYIKNSIQIILRD